MALQSCTPRPKPRALGSGGERDASGQASGLFSFTLSGTPLKLITISVRESVSLYLPLSAAGSPALKRSAPDPDGAPRGEHTN